MTRWWRWAILGAVVVVGLGLAALGISEWRELLDIGVGAPEVLRWKVPLTTVSLFLGLVMLLWTFLAGLPWVRSRRDGSEEQL